jgi:predicted transposase YdaD
MPGDYDPTLKALVETSPADWLPLVGRPPAPVTVIDADISTITSGAMDKLLHVHADPDYLVHLDFQAGHDSAQLPPRLRLYNAVKGDEKGLPVLSTAVLLHPGADSPRLTGVYAEGLPGEEPYSVFRYGVVRVWQLPVERLLTGGLATLPLAPISDVPEGSLPDVIRRMKERLARRDARRLAPDLWAATDILLGLRYSEEFAKVLLRGVLAMKESVTYQAIVAEGRAEGLAEGVRHTLIKIGEQRLGRVDALTRAAINAIDDVGKLDELVERVLTVATWHELLGQPPRRRNGRRKGNH